MCVDCSLNLLVQFVKELASSLICCKLVIIKECRLTSKVIKLHCFPSGAAVATSLCLHPCTVLMLTAVGSNGSVVNIAECVYTINAL